jgi:hypothetical protein
MNLETNIKVLKARLIKKVEKSGLYENFGDKEICFLEDNFINRTDNEQMLLCSFKNWCVNYEG